MGAKVYPHMVYRADGVYRVVQNEEELTELGEGWQEKPFPPAPAEPESPTTEERLTALEERVEALETRKKK
jgi:hypothetical protein